MRIRRPQHQQVDQARTGCECPIEEACCDGDAGRSRGIPREESLSKRHIPFGVAEGVARLLQAGAVGGILIESSPV